MKGLQEQFLNSLRKASIPATFYLVNGFQMKGLVRAFDDYTVVVECNGCRQLVFKHAVSTIAPHRPVELPAEQ